MEIERHTPTNNSQEYPPVPCYQMSYVPENEVHMKLAGYFTVFFSGITLYYSY